MILKQRIRKVILQFGMNVQYHIKALNIFTPTIYSYHRYRTLGRDCLYTDKFGYAKLFF